MTPHSGHAVKTALIVALGGFLMGFDASVISGVVSFIEPEFGLTKIQVGWIVSCLTLTATLGMLISGPLSDRFGRRAILMWAAVVFALSAVGSALAFDQTTLVLARMLGGLGVGAALIVAPLYIAEMAPAEQRGRLVSLNQLNIVIGISAAYFSNYLILHFSKQPASWVTASALDSDPWRWMLGIEAVPALIYLIALFAVPESPRWLVLSGRIADAKAALGRIRRSQDADDEIDTIHAAISQDSATQRLPLLELFSPAIRGVLVIGIIVAILQQITGINAVFFYAPTIFEQSGIGTDASFMQAVLVGLTNVVFTILAIALIDRLGRRPLLIFGLAGIVVSMGLLAYGFGQATYALDAAALSTLPDSITAASLQPLSDAVFPSDLAFREAMIGAVGADTFVAHQAQLTQLAINMNPTLILVGILGFVASFAMSLGPVMWVLFSELFPNRVRALAISFVGLINSGVSFLVQLLFPWELENLGNSMTFVVFGSLALAGLLLVIWLFPETKGRSLEQLEAQLVRS